MSVMKKLLLIAALALAPLAAHAACDDVFSERKASLEEGGVTVKQVLGEVRDALLALYRSKAGAEAEVVDTVYIAAGNERFMIIMTKDDCIMVHSSPVSAAGLAKTLVAARNLKPNL